MALKAYDMTQKELAEKLGESEANVNQYANDKRNPKKKTLIRYAKAIGCDPKSLKGDEKEWDE